MRHLITRLMMVLVAIGWIACGGSTTEKSGAGGASAPAPTRAAVAVDKNAYPVFPDRDAGADPSVPAEQGGRGFTGEGWQTNTDFDLIGDPRAIKGGVLRDYIIDFPSTLRTRGPEANTALNYNVVLPLVYESLVGMHSTTLEFMPSLASHWQISSDRMTYRFRIDPNARWSDGKPVVADDVVATWALSMDKGLQDPSAQLVFGKFEKPVAETKYIVSVKSKQLNWR